jgi:hydroxymethylbilane synthase
MKLRIGTRGSKLALWQANYTKHILDKAGIESEIVIIKTQGDNIQHLGFDKLEGKGFFTKEIEDQLLDGKVDMAVHSMKDMPTSQPDGLVLSAVSYREDPRDTLLIRKDKVDRTQDLRLVKGAIVGTSSVRRKAQILDLNPNVQTKDIRGNVPTRIQKMQDGNFDAILLASAGITRLELDLSDMEVIHLHPREFVPAPAQGVLAYQCRLEDYEVRKVLLKLHDPDVVQCTNVERKVLKMMDGGCHVPLGVYCERDINNNFHAYAAYQPPGEPNLKRVTLSQSTTFGLAEKVFEELQK